MFLVRHKQIVTRAPKLLVGMSDLIPSEMFLIQERHAWWFRWSIYLLSCNEITKRNGFHPSHSKRGCRSLVYQRVYKHLIYIWHSQAIVSPSPIAIKSAHFKLMLQLIWWDSKTGKSFVLGNIEWNHELWCSRACTSSCASCNNRISARAAKFVDHEHAADQIDDFRVLYFFNALGQRET